MDYCNLHSYLPLKQMLILHHGHLIGPRTDFILEHLFVNAMMRVRIKVIVFGCLCVILGVLLRLGRFCCGFGHFVYVKLLSAELIVLGNGGGGRERVRSADLVRLGP
jgi:hypothetical protein